MFPNEYGLMAGAAQALALAGGEENIARAVRLTECALAGDMREKPRATARAALCFMYRMAGEPEKARQLARNLPHVWESREILLSAFLDPPERAAYRHESLPRLQRFIQATAEGKELTDAQWLRWLICGKE